jgi:hypothetical protein
MLKKTSLPLFVELASEKPLCLTGGCFYLNPGDHLFLDRFEVAMNIPFAFFQPTSRNYTVSRRFWQATVRHPWHHNVTLR